MRVFKCCEEKTQTWRAPTELTWEQIKEKEGVYKLPDGLVRFVVIKSADRTAVLFVLGHNVEPAEEGWQLFTFERVENATVCFEIKENN